MTAQLVPSRALKTRLATGPVFGSFIFSPDPAHTEIVGAAGFDFAIIDTEHAPLGALEVTQHVRAARAAGCSPIARVRGDEPADIGRLLDTGVDGIMLPHIGMDLARTEAALDAMRYAPEGSRPTCSGVRSADYGLAQFAETATSANRDVLSIGLLEDASVLDTVDEVLQRCQLDVVIPGPGDLAASLGVPGQMEHPLVVAAVEKVIAAARAAGSRVGVYVVSSDAARRWAGKGIDLFLVSIDQRVLAQAYQSLRTGLTDVLADASTAS